MMEANPSSLQLVIELQQEFGRLVRSNYARTEFRFTSTQSATTRAFQELTDSLRQFKQSNLLNYTGLGINEQGHVEVDIETIEPAFSRFFFGNFARLNNEDIRIWLINNSSNGTQKIDNEKVYTCNLQLKHGTSDVYLVWEGGEELLYHFENTASPRFRVFQYLIQHPDQSFTLEYLKEESVVPKSTAKLHEYFSKTFVKGIVRKKFALYSEKERIGIRAIASTTGDDLIRLIRESLVAMENDQQRHYYNRIRKAESSQ